MADEPARRAPLVNLTSLRFFAAAYVLLYHTRNGRWFGLGYTGVTLFFVLSGFILAYNYPTVPQETRRRFFVARFARIYPIYFVGCFAMFPWFIPGEAGHPLRATMEVFSYLTLTQTWIPAFTTKVNPGGWSLSVETLFYLLFPFIIGPVTRLSRRWIPAIAVCAIGLVLPTSLAFLYWLPGHPEQKPVIDGILASPPFYIGIFLIGMIFGIRFLEHRPTFSGRMVLAATLLCLGCITLGSQIPETDHRIVQGGLLALPYGILIYTLAGWKSRFLGHPILQLGGEVSYCIYMFSWVFVELVQSFFHHYRGMVLVRFLLFLSCNYLPYQFIEKPARNWILKAFHVRSHPKPIETLDPALP